MPPQPCLLWSGNVSPFRANTAKGEWVSRGVSIQTVIKKEKQTFSLTSFLYFHLKTSKYK